MTMTMAVDIDTGMGMGAIDDAKTTNAQIVRKSLGGAIIRDVTEMNRPCPMLPKKRLNFRDVLMSTVAREMMIPWRTSWKASCIIFFGSAYQ